MSLTERAKQVLDAIAYFGGLATGVSVIALVVTFAIAHWADRSGSLDAYDYEEDGYEEYNECPD